MLTGDPHGEAVLRELADDPAPHVQALAKFALQRVESPDAAERDAVNQWMIRYSTFDAQ